MSNDRSPLFRVRDVYKTYQAGEVVVHALNGVDLDLFDREFVVLLGASGSGKSTLLHILGGLDRPTSGTIEYRDHDLAHADEVGLTLYRREHVGFVFQFYNLIPSLTALENVALVADIAEHPMNPLDALELVGLSARKDHFPGVIGAHDVRTRKMGDMILVDVHLDINAAASVREGHDIALEARRRVMSRKDVLNVMTHVDPVDVA